MPTISRLSINSSLAIPSKHFFKCGCTRRGSLVSDKISSSSSFDRKKNLFQSKGRWQLESLLGTSFSNEVGPPPQQVDDTPGKPSCHRGFSKTHSLHQFSSRACRVELVLTLRVRERMKACISEFKMFGGLECYLLKENWIQQWFSVLAAPAGLIFENPMPTFYCPEIHV